MKAWPLDQNAAFRIHSGLWGSQPQVGFSLDCVAGLYLNIESIRWLTTPIDIQINSGLTFYLF